jgi:hypothetical protein
MRTSEPIIFRMKNRPQKQFLLTLVGFEDDGIRMRFPIGKPDERLLLGETLIDPNGELYAIKKIGLYSDLIWLEKLIEEENLAS